MTKIKVCSLFSGIGGFEVGIFKSLGKNNTEIVFSSEIDKFASAAYQKIFNHKPHGDIREVNAELIPDHDLLVGGFPCQAFSIAGKRKGFNDTRGTLFFEIARIAKEKKPKMIILENVKGLLNHDSGNTLEVILKTLSDIGYAVDFNILNSKYYNVPQNRERIFIVAVIGEKREQWNLSNLKGSLLKTKKNLQKMKQFRTFNFEFPDNSEIKKTISEIIEKDVDKKYFLSKEKTEKLLDKLHNKNFSRETIIKRDGHGYHKFEKISPTLTANSGTGGNNMPFIIDTKQIGEPRQYYDYSPTLQANDYKEPKQLAFYDDKKRFSIRKLTPKECLRLQSFPDAHYRKMKSINISDTQIYKMAGNAVTTNVIKSIIDKAKKYF